MKRLLSSVASALWMQPPSDLPAVNMLKTSARKRNGTGRVTGIAKARRMARKRRNQLRRGQ